MDSPVRFAYQALICIIRMTWKSRKPATRLFEEEALMATSRFARAPLIVCIVSLVLATGAAAQTLHEDTATFGRALRQAGISAS
jgi:hypothetical protein